MIDPPFILPFNPSLADLTHGSLIDQEIERIQTSDATLPHTRAAKMHTLDTWRTVAGPTKLRDTFNLVNPAIEFIQQMASDGKARGTINHHIAILAGYHRRIQQTYPFLLLCNPFEIARDIVVAQWKQKWLPPSETEGSAPGVPRSPQPRRQPEFHQAGFAFLYALAASFVDGVLILFLIFTGVRLDEALSLDIGRITWTGPEAGKVILKPRGKRTNCEIWLPREFLALLMNYLRIDRGILPEQLLQHANEPLFLNKSRTRYNRLRAETLMQRFTVLLEGRLDGDYYAIPPAQRLQPHGFRGAHATFAEYLCHIDPRHIAWGRGDKPGGLPYRETYVRMIREKYRAEYLGKIFTIRQLCDAGIRAYEFQHPNELRAGIAALTRLGYQWETTPAPLLVPPFPADESNAGTPAAATTPETAPILGANGEASTVKPIRIRRAVWGIRPNAEELQPSTRSALIFLRGHPERVEALRTALKLEATHNYADNDGFEWLDIGLDARVLRYMLLRGLLRVAIRKGRTYRYRIGDRKLVDEVLRRLEKEIPAEPASATIAPAQPVTT